MSLDYLGTALKHPVTLVNGKGATVDGKKVIEQSIIDILDTPVGSKFFLEEYGSRIRTLIFEPNDEVLEDLLSLFIFEAMEAWEKRAKFQTAIFSHEGAVTSCRIYYRILNSNETDSFVYPFYRTLKY